MNNGFYSSEELKEMGFKSVGRDVLISRKTSIYGAENMSIGDHVRIDDFCLLNGNITLHNYIHIAAFCLLSGRYGIEMKDFSGLSCRCAIYSGSDDYSGNAMTNPTIPDEYKNTYGGKVVLEKHSIVGTGSTILPDVTLGEGVSVGSMSLVTKSLEPWGIYVGIPCKRVKDRSKKLLELENKFKEANQDA